MLPRWVERCRSWARGLWQRASHSLVRTPLEELDPDVREIFLAELDELSETLATLLPDWRNNPSDPALLQSMRRAFHTIKGSGLMVGALSIAGVCGRLERLMVQLIERRMTATPELQAIFGDAVRLLPECRRAIEAGVPMPAAMREIGVRAQRLLG
ncbi:MAG: Hpt domain-containing protein [Pseudomarimonas sp.]